MITEGVRVRVRAIPLFLYTLTITPRVSKGKISSYKSEIVWFIVVDPFYSGLVTNEEGKGEAYRKETKENKHRGKCMNYSYCENAL